MEVSENKAVWDGKYHWADDGNEWSAPWGGVAHQWYGSIWPRIMPFVPVGRVVEIACGKGRMTHFLKDFASQYIGIDLSVECVEACRSRFANCSHMGFEVNDGLSLDVIPDGFADFVFSFDSLVHADTQTMTSYIQQLPRILSRGGVAFLHHSNVGAYEPMVKRIKKVPKLYGGLIRLGVLQKSHYWRDPLVSAKGCYEVVQAAGLHCVSQELIRWRDARVYCDAFTVVAQRNSSWSKRPYQMWRNPDFAREAGNLLRIAKHYHVPDLSV